jgi:excisionase family DNA binding protein
VSQVPPSYTTIEVAKRLGVSMQTVQRWVDAGRLRAWKTLGGHRRIEARSAEMLFEARALATSAAPPSTAAATAPANTAPAPLRVVIVDDNAIDRELLAKLVQKAIPGAAVTMAENGFQALVSIGREAPDIVITDIHMPHMNGFEMIRHLWADDALRPRILVAVSAQSAADMATMGQLPAAVVYLSKPVDEAHLARALLQTRQVP